MIEEPITPAFQLKLLADAMRDAEQQHHQIVPLREDFAHVPTGCSCGAEYTSWEESKQHLREQMARALVRALHRPCETCLGTGKWVKLRGEFECPDCEGRGRTLTPLPPLLFQDFREVTWAVDPFDAQDRDALMVQVRRVT